MPLSLSRPVFIHYISRAQSGFSVFICVRMHICVCVCFVPSWVYDCERGRWRAGVAMLGARFSHCSVVLQGCVYCIGGYRAGAATARTEQYDPLKRRWQALADMVQGVCGGGVGRRRWSHGSKAEVFNPGPQGPPCPARFQRFPAPTHLIQMNGSLSTYAEAR